jgi:hypothetical protein
VTGVGRAGSFSGDGAAGVAGAAGAGSLGASDGAGSGIGIVSGTGRLAGSTSMILRGSPMSIARMPPGPVRHSAYDALAPCEGAASTLRRVEPPDRAPVIRV